MYSQVELVPLATVTARDTEEGKIAACIDGSSAFSLNEYLSKGWKLIQVINHHSEKKDCTVAVALIGYPI